MKLSSKLFAMPLAFVTTMATADDHAARVKCLASIFEKPKTLSGHKAPVRFHKIGESTFVQISEREKDYDKVHTITVVTPSGVFVYDKKNLNHRERFVAPGGEPFVYSGRVFVTETNANDPTVNLGSHVEKGGMGEKIFQNHLKLALNSKKLIQKVDSQVEETLNTAKSELEELEEQYENATDSQKKALRAKIHKKKVEVKRHSMTSNLAQRKEGLHDDVYEDKINNCRKVPEAATFVAEMDSYFKAPPGSVAFAEASPVEGPSSQLPFRKGANVGEIAK